MLFLRQSEGGQFLVDGSRRTEQDAESPSAVSYNFAFCTLSVVQVKLDNLK